MFHASTASISASGVPATPLTVCPVLFRPQSSLKRASLGLMKAWTMPSGSANSTFGSRESRAATAASWPAGTVTRSVRGTSRLRLNAAPTAARVESFLAADAAGLVANDDLARHDLLSEEAVADDISLRGVRRRPCRHGCGGEERSRNKTCDSLGWDSGGSWRKRGEWTSVSSHHSASPWVCSLPRSRLTMHALEQIPRSGNSRGVADALNKGRSVRTVVNVTRLRSPDETC